MTPHAYIRNTIVSTAICFLLSAAAVALSAKPVRAQAFAGMDLSAAVPASQGLSPQRLNEMAAWVRDENLNVRSLLVARRGRLAFEWYGEGITRDDHHNIYSVTKSVVGLLAGIAVAEGRIDGVGATMADMFPAAAGTMTERKQSMTLEHLLTMRSGFPVSRGNRPQGAERKLFLRIHRAADRQRLILGDLKPKLQTGKRFAYNNIDPDVVGMAVAEAAGESLPKFAERTLFQPLGFKNTEWKYADKAGHVPGGYGLHLRAVDLAKLGQLVLNRGQWHDHHLIPPPWIAAATSDRTGTGYGYYWWLDSENGVVAAKGVRGQRLFQVPKLDLLMVVTSDLPADKVPAVTKTLLETYLLKAVLP